MGVPGSRALQGVRHIPAFTHQMPVLPPPQLLCVVRCHLGHMLMWSLKGQGKKTRGQVAHAKGLGGPGQGRKEDLPLGCEGSARNWPVGEEDRELEKCRSVRRVRRGARGEGQAQTRLWAEVSTMGCVLPRGQEGSELLHL